MTKNKIVFDRKTDIIQVVAPSSKRPDFYEAIEKFTLLCREYGINSSVSEGLFSDDCLPFLSNSLEYRYNDFLDALKNDDIKIIWSIRGGYGSSEIANLLKDYKINSPKILIGFSDITSLHLLFNNYFFLPSIHGAMIFDILKDSKVENLKKIFNLFKSNKIEYKLKRINIIAKTIESNIEESDSHINTTIESYITGGNLTVLCSNIGGLLKAEHFEDKILFLEDVGEISYKVQRCLIQLYHGGFLSKIKAIIFCEFVGSDENLERTLQSFISKYCNTIPAFELNIIGHGEINQPLILGSPCKIINDILTIEIPFEMA
jgi:muramoyltetrapeptide carboxypeptidase